MLVVDETGDVKKGSHTVGVQRQYTDTAGRIENTQVAVCLVCAGALCRRPGHAVVDRELYLPRSHSSQVRPLGGLLRGMRLRGRRELWIKRPVAVRAAAPPTGRCAPHR